MSTDDEYNGWWWLPNANDIKHPGTFFKNKEGLFILKLLGNFQEYKYLLHDLNGDKSIPIIIGEAKKSNTNQDFDFTILNSKIYDFKESSLTECSYCSKLVLENTVCLETNKIRFQELFIRFRHLDEWVNRSGFEIKNDFNDKKLKFAIEYNHPDPIYLYKGSRLDIYIHKRGHINHVVKNGPDTNEESFLNVQFHQKQNLNSIAEFVDQLKSLFTLFISVPFETEKIEVQKHSSKVSKKLNIDYQETIKLHISDKSSHYHYSNYSKILMLLPLEGIKNRSQLIFEGWLDKMTKFEPTIKLYIDTLYNDRLYAQNKFLNYVSAIEIYHRRFCSTFNPKDDAYNKKLQKILETIPNKDHRNWVKSRLLKKNEIYLKSRFNDIFKTNRTVLKGFIPNKISFINKIVSTRNHFVHFNEKTNTHTINDEYNLRVNTFKLQILIQIIFLKELGFNDQEINSIIKKPIVNSIYYYRK